MKIAVLPSFTSRGINETLTVKCAEQGIIADIYLSLYNQYHQDILNSKSPLYQHHPELIILFIDTRSFIEGQFLTANQITDQERLEWVEQAFKEMVSLITELQNHSSAKIVVHNFEIPVFSPYGILETKQDFGIREGIERINQKLRDFYKKNSQVFIFDYDLFCGKIGKMNVIDYKMYYLGDFRFNFHYIPQLADEYISYIKPLAGMSSKCIVLDLDNTLWGGIVGEDGFEGIRLGPTPEGRPFWEFQKYLLSLFNRGIILAINSKNNPDDALKVIREHPSMVLKETHFASIAINWNDKISNMKSIASEVNIGLDSLVFFDDDRINREMIKKALPEVLVVEMPADPSLYVQTLASLNVFNTFQITEEDLTKGQMYADQRLRAEFQKTVTDITEYLEGLEMVVTIQKADTFTIPRISQLTQKTNQFNMTTRRYSEENIGNFSCKNHYLVVSIQVTDKFGDNGITGAAIIEKRKEFWMIDTLLLSCRVIGRRIEEVLLAYIIENAKSEGIKTIIGEFIPTKKNLPARDFFKSNHFNFIKNEGDAEIWSYDVSSGYNAPDFIKIITR